ncbi:VacJ family lipoprotein [Novosphingobium sp. fls2-241-R2A-195]|uniref:MlaA family lipoprotein n=1 Tax=Novosphingobium sp. fls2-241-R2A-195 TaxID=3040296 RepID=UPI002550A0F2|nr:VacJ family lipoprotein [Novosphingobium sp. fls2-241-R2A-195]
MSLTAAAVAVMISSVAPEAGVPATTPVTTEATTFSQPAADAATDAQAAPAQPATDAAVPAPAEQAEAPADTAQTGNEIIVMPRKPPPPGDPLERINEKSFQTVQAVDKAVLEPVAKVYNKGLPRPVRQGLRNFFSNLTEPVVFVAYLLELKPGKAAETVGRFAINTTIGAAGFVDMAKRKPFNLPYRPNGLANVLGYYGVGPGPYFYLPIVGPTTLRDIIGDTVDRALLPAVVGSPFNKPEVVIPSTILSQLGERAAFDDEIRRIREEENPYAAYRELYLQQRKAEIEALHGRVTPGVVPVYGPGMKTAGKSKASEQAAPEAPAAETAAPEATVPEAAAPTTSTPGVPAPTPSIVPEPVQP